MAITTLAGVRAGMIQPIPITKGSPGTPSAACLSLWAMGGYPPAGSYNATLNGVALTGPVTGGIPFTNPVSGNTYIAGWRGRSRLNYYGGSWWICDRLWHNGGYTITSTSAQNSTTPAWPARDANGSTNGEGVFLAVEVSAATGAGTPTITISYTNSAGTAGRSATNIQATITTSSTASTYLIGLQAGDLGVRSVQSLTLSATWTSGTINLVAYRPIFPFTLNAGANAPSGQTVMEDALTSGFPRVFDSSVLYYMNVEHSSFVGMAPIGVLRLTQG